MRKLLCTKLISIEQHDHHISYGMCLKNDVSAVEIMPTEYEANLSFSDIKQHCQFMNSILAILKLQLQRHNQP